MASGLNLITMEGRYSVCRLPGEMTVPQPEGIDGLWAAIRTPGGRTLVCREEDAPASAEIEAGWRVLQVEGPLSFELVGILADLLQPLKAEGVTVFVLSSFETDFILLREEDLTAARSALLDAGYHFLPKV